MLDFGSTSEGRALDESWRDAAERAKRNTTVFAQRRLKPDDVLPEWNKTLSALGSRDDVARFTDRALARLGSGLERLRRGFKAPLAPLPDDVRERLAAEGMSGTLRIDFSYPSASGCRPVQRSHPLVSVLAETLLERTLAAGDGKAESDPAVLGRVGCWVSSSVINRTVVVILRLRHQLTTQRAGQSSMLLVEEATALAWSGASAAAAADGHDAMMLLTPPPAADPPSIVQTREIRKALELLAGRGTELEAFAERRAQTLLADHRRVREAASARGSYAVRALLPPDVIGLFVLLPQVS
jgi:hypothetical protein